MIVVTFAGRTNGQVVRFNGRPTPTLGCLPNPPDATTLHTVFSWLGFTQELPAEGPHHNTRQAESRDRDHPMIRLNINGQDRDVDVPGDMPLLWVLRDELNLTGTKFGCGIAQCGACTVHMDGTPIRACQTPAESAAGTKITTIEGVSGTVAQAVQAAWQKLDVVQCGYCQSGQIMSAVALLTDNRNPTDDDIDAAMDGNVCRCATYPRIRAAIKDAAKAMGA